MRPWLDWRTLRVPGYRLHFPRELEPWTRNVAARLESIDSTVAALVGFAPPRPVDVVVDDPFRIANGYVLPFIDRPATVWWATPPDPRTDIGNFRNWGEILSVHEVAHLAHLTRPSRNPLIRQLWASLPVNLGPITLKAPRWVYEGYATMVEGRVTGSGRPNNAWRPAFLRQWAIEGRLPTYGQLNAWDDFAGGEFAYLGGSAFLEWLAPDGGVAPPASASPGLGTPPAPRDAPLVQLWRRLSARQSRDFDAAFTGVFGDSPRVLYGRHVAELTRDAMAAKDALERAGLVEGELVQRLTWDTGDPAVAPDGRRVALVLHERERPGRLVVWSADPEPPDTAAQRKQLERLKRDPEDVADRRVYPRGKKAIKELPAEHARAYQHPRWFADSRRLLATRWTVRGDGSFGPALYEWDTESDDVRRVTDAVGVLHGDPHPSAAEAVAMHCHAGRCDIVRVELATGALTPLLAGDPGRSYYRPRFAPDGARFAASVNEGGRWRIVIADRDGRNARVVDPGDRANRYDAQWIGADSLVVVSEAGGIPNLELLQISDAGTRALTRVTGAAVAPDVDRRRRAIWFLSLHARGLDVRRIPRDSVRPADSVVTISSDRFGFAGARGPHAGIALRERPVGASRRYGAGPRHHRWLPGGYGSADGAGAFITVFSGDLVGRLNAALTGALGERGSWQGASLRATWRYPRPAIDAGVHGFLHEPSLGGHPQPGADSLDAEVFQGVIAASAERRGEGWSVRARIGGSAGHLNPTLGAGYFRGLGFAEAQLNLAQSSGARGVVERLRLHASEGHTRTVHRRVVGSLEVETVGRDMLPLFARVLLGRMSGDAHPFEQFSIGGGSSPVGDSAFLRQRVAMPVFPTAVATGEAVLAWRVAFPASPWTLYYEGASAAPAGGEFRRWHRAVGLDTRFAYGPVPVAFAPRVALRAGAGYALDPPFRKKLRAFFEMTIEP